MRNIFKGTAIVILVWVMAILSALLCNYFIKIDVVTTSIIIFVSAIAIDYFAYKIEEKENY